MFGLPLFDPASQWRGSVRLGVAIGLLGLLGVLVAGRPVPAVGQIVVPELEELSPESQVEEGVWRLRAGKPTEAVEMLQPLLDADSALVDSKRGAVAYWLGRAYDAAGESKTAHRVWETGLRALRTEGKTDARLADAYLRALTPTQLRGERLYAVDVYRSLLSNVGTDTTRASRAVYRRRVAQLAPLMADSLLGRIIEQPRTAPESTWTFRSEAGAALTKWWRGLDPLPATQTNERLEEHLTRLVHVEEEYSCDEQVGGLDDRGTVYLRFGDPYKQRPIRYKGGEFFREVYRFGVDVSASSFPKTEMWIYPHIDQSGYYVFAEEETTNCFTIARANDLIPSHLTMRRPDSERGLNIAYSALMAMRAIYRELALYHIDFATRFTDIANYAGWQEMKATEARAAEAFGEEYNGRIGESSVEIGAGVGQTRRVFENPTLGYQFPNSFVDRMVARAEREDRQAAEEREKEMPNQYTTLLEGAAHLPVELRTARFLNEDGTTRTEIYWGVNTSDLVLEEEDADTLTAEPSMITFSAVRYDRQRRAQVRKHRRYEVSADPDSSRQGLATDVIPLGSADGPFHLGLQWEQFELWQRDSTSAPKQSLGPRRRLTTIRADTMKPLRATGPQIEMSDVKVLTLPDSNSTADQLERARPYPFRTLTPTRPLVLSFEVYHLTYGPDDRTRYTLSYEAEGRTRGGGWAHPFRGPETQRTTTEMTVRGSSRRTSETMLLDLSELSRDELQDLEVTVRVTDEVNDTTVSRTLEFELRPETADPLS